ncbi:hypothetical protein LXA43DRAFT_906842 [Ganoderma leucocontextum]|nr:hypothetical protein LXA43DRAFT_906842 [Ganoderma leucocontextum]
MTTEDSAEEERGRYLLHPSWEYLPTEDEIYEKRTYHVIKDKLQGEIPEMTAVKTGPCTILTDVSLEFPGVLSHVDGQTFLLRDAKIFNGKGGCYGHAIVQVFPYTAENLKRFEQWPVITTNDMVRCPVITLDVHIEGAQVPFVLDTGSEIDCISAKLWELLSGTRSNLGNSCKIIGVTGQQLQCLGVWETAIEFNMVWSISKLHIIKGLKVPGILGCPWQRANLLKLEHTPDGISVQVRSPEKPNQLPMTMHIAQRVRKRPEYASVPASSLCGYITEQLDDKAMEDQELDLEITQEPLGSDPWKADEETGEPPGDEPLLSQVNWENKLYQNLIKLYSDKAGRNIKPHRPQLELIEPFEADQVDWTRIATPQIAESEETFLLRNVLLKINGDYREGHAVLHVTYFPHESERVCYVSTIELLSSMS